MISRDILVTINGKGGDASGIAYGGWGYWSTSHRQTGFYSSIKPPAPMSTRENLIVTLKQPMHLCWEPQERLEGLAEEALLGAGEEGCSGKWAAELNPDPR